MKKCSYCGQSPKIGVLKNEDETFICFPCLMNNYSGELGWMGQQVAQGIINKVENALSGEKK